jgi:tetratricopeptide (TPR) repeat protein
MPTTTTEPSGSVATALAHAQRLLDVDPRLAAEQAVAILEAVPRHAEATLILATPCGCRATPPGPARGRSPGAGPCPGAAGPAGARLILAAAGQTQAAVAAFKRALALGRRAGRGLAGPGRGLELLATSTAPRPPAPGRSRAGSRDPLLMRAAAALVDERPGEAETLLRGLLETRPDEPAAIRMLAEAVARLGRQEEAETLLTRCLELAPGFTAARHNLATVLYRLGRSEAALASSTRCWPRTPRNPAYLNLKAAALARIGEYAQAIAIYEDVLARYPQQPKGWMSYGHALKTVGRSADCVAAYRKAVDQAPSWARPGGAWPT